MIKKAEFQNVIYSYYKNHGRDLPWRYETDPYKIFISEVMLQQTQVSRVLLKYPEFIKSFPSFDSLSKASLSQVLTVWQGMGYNRRGKYLKEAAGIVVNNKQYVFLLRHSERSEESSSNEILQSLPLLQNDVVSLLRELPGIGHATACAIATYAFNIPTVFIETNIRSVYLYFFFQNKQNVSDAAIVELVEKTLDLHNPRDWYYALTDYGVYLKTHKKFKNTSSKHYSKQLKFEGSRRQLRGKILKLLLESRSNSIEEINDQLSDDERIQSVLIELVKDQLIQCQGNNYYIDSGLYPE